MNHSDQTVIFPCLPSVNIEGWGWEPPQLSLWQVVEVVLRQQSQQPSRLDKQMLFIPLLQRKHSPFLLVWKCSCCCLLFLGFISFNETISTMVIVNIGFAIRKKGESGDVNTGGLNHIRFWMHRLLKQNLFFFYVTVVFIHSNLILK